MTKTIVIGEHKPATPKKPIQITHWLNPYNMVFEPAHVNLRNHSNIELICKNYMDYQQDLMFAYNDPDARQKGVFYFGQWNDGVVE